MKMTKKNEVIVVYDGECSFCSKYCQSIKLKEAFGTLELVDARKLSPMVERITDLGLDLDQGMVVSINDRIYYGSAAIGVLSHLSSNSDLFNRINSAVFTSKRLSSIAYPLLKMCRSFSLWHLNINAINNLKSKVRP